MFIFLLSPDMTAWQLIIPAGPRSQSDSPVQLSAGVVRGGYGRQVSVRGPGHNFLTNLQGCLTEGSVNSPATNIFYFYFLPLLVGSQVGVYYICYNTFIIELKMASQELFMFSLVNNKFYQVRAFSHCNNWFNMEVNRNRKRSLIINQRLAK